MEKVILTKNDQALKQVYDNANRATKQINDFIQESQKECNVNFSNEEKFSLLTNGATFLQSWIKGKYLFPTATNDFNENALGIDVKGLIKKYNSITPAIKDYNFKLNEAGNFELDGEPKGVNACYTYAETPGQLKALKLAEKLSKLLNEASSLGLLENRLLGNLTEMGNLLSTENTVKNQIIVIPNKYRISKFVN